MNHWTLTHQQLQAAQAKQLATILRDLPDNDTRTLRDTKHYGSPAGDERKLRGIPIQARGITGTSPGTNPLHELMAKQANHH